MHARVVSDAQPTSLAPALETQTRVGNKQSKYRRRRMVFAPYLFTLPALILVLIWIYSPLLQTFWDSFFHGTLTNGIDTFVGWRNYQRVLSTPEFRQSLVNTGLYILGLLPLTVVLPLLVAFLLSKVRGPLQSFYRSLLFTPVIMAPVVASAIWLWLLDPVDGVLNHVLGLFGLPGVNWLNQSNTAVWVIMVITAWKTFGFSLLLFLAAIVGVDREYLEAARLDGASEFAILRFIILPQIMPTFSFLLIYTVLYAGQWVFSTVNVLTQGGPNNTTASVFYTLYQYGFQFFNIGYASAAAVMIFLVLAVGTLLVMRFTDRRTYYES